MATDKYAGMSAIEKMDLIHTEQRHDRDMSALMTERTRLESEAQVKAKRSETRKGVIIGLFCTVAFATVGLGFFDWLGERPDNPSDSEIEVIREENCMEAGGTWLPKSFVAGDKGACVMPGGQKR